MTPRLLLPLCLAVALCYADGAAWAQAVPQSREQIHLSFSPVAKAAAPAVVNIYTRRVVRAQQPLSPLLEDPFFRRFFGDQFQFGLPQERIQRSLGSGVIVRGSGVVVTNHHVVKDSDAITVVLNDRREFEAAIVGTDERTDIAVLQIDAGGEPLPALEMGDSDAIEVGDLVLAIGNPFGVGQTVTSGIVSALARTTVGIGDFRSFIQTDAAINPGNSGGALVDMSGRLVGINTAIYSRDGGSLGIGFAIPTTMVKAVIAGITHGGKAVRPWLGAGGQPVAAEMAAALRLSRPMGVLINDVYSGGPADRGGLRVGDVVVAVNGREIEDAEALRFRIATLPVGQPAELTIMRKGAERRLTVGLVTPPEDPPRDEVELSGLTPFAGATVANLNPALIEENGMAVSARGVVVIKVRRGSVAHRLEIRPGDIILKINDRTVERVEDLRRSLAARADGWKIALRRDGEVVTFVVGK